MNATDLYRIPKSAPLLSKVSKSKSKKVLKLGSHYFFITETKAGITVYSINIGCQILYSPFETRNEVINYLVSKLSILDSLAKDPSSITIRLSND